MGRVLTSEVIADGGNLRESFGNFGNTGQSNLPPGQQPIYGSYGMRGGYTIYADKRVKLSESKVAEFESMQKALYAKTKLA